MLPFITVFVNSFFNYLVSYHLQSYKQRNQSKLPLIVQKLSNRSKVVYKKKKRPVNSLKSDYY